MGIFRIIAGKVGLLGGSDNTAIGNTSDRVHVDLVDPRITSNNGGAPAIRVAQSNPPTGISLDSKMVQTGALPGSHIGTLRSIDSLSDPAGDVYSIILDNDSKFQIVGNELQILNPPDISDVNYDVTIRVTDADGYFFEKVFTINVVIHAPITDLLFSTSVVSEDAPVGFAVGTFSTAGGLLPVTYSLLLDQYDYFEIVGAQLLVKNPLSYAESLGSASITVFVVDSNGQIFEKSFTVGITPMLPFSQFNCASIGRDSSADSLIQADPDTVMYNDLVGDLTVAFRVCFFSISANAFMENIISLEGTPNFPSSNAVFRIVTGANGIGYGHDYGAGSRTQENFKANEFGATLKPNVWYNVVMVRDATAKTVTLYMNGHTTSSITYINDVFQHLSAPDASFKLRISDGAFNGDAPMVLKNMRIWNSTLNATEAQEVIDTPDIELTSRFADLYAKWEMGDDPLDTAVSLNDSIGNKDLQIGTSVITPSFEYSKTYTAFNGVNQYCEITNATIASAMSGAFSIVMYVHMKNNSSGVPLIFANTDGKGFVISTDSFKDIHIKIFESATEYIHVESSSTVWETNIMQPMAITYDGSNTAAGVKVYTLKPSLLSLSTTSGLTINSDTIATTAQPTAGPIYLGGDPATPEFDDSEIDDVSFYNAELTASEVSNLLLSGAPVNPFNFDSKSKILRHWNMGDDQTAPNIVETQGTGDDLLMVNMSAASFVDTP